MNSAFCTNLEGLGLAPSERQYLASALKNGEAPDLEGMWALMDAAWDECECDTGRTNEPQDSTLIPCGY